MTADGAVFISFLVFLDARRSPRARHGIELDLGEMEAGGDGHGLA